MAKLFLKKNSVRFPKLIIVEGFWKIGKTKIINYLAQRFGYIVIPELNHLKNNISQDISQWYHQKHLERYDQMEKKLKQKEKIIVERSVISNIAFSYAKTHKLSENFKVDLEKIKKRGDLLIIFLYGNKNFIKERVIKLKDYSVKKQILENPNFYKNYVYFYKNLLPSRIDNKIIFIKVDNKNAFNKFSDIIKRIETKIMVKDRDYQINCIVLKRQGRLLKDIKFLLLKRIQRKGGFWQPITGGAFFSEDKIAALKRELEEETGIKQKEIKNIINTNYSFSFVNDEGNKLQEYVYGVEINPNQKIVISKEHTEARWVGFKTALKLLKYESNKKGFRMLYEILKKRE